MGKRNLRERLDNSVNAGSMADIAFLLLIFFLVTTTIKEDQGILVKLPPWDPNPVDTKINPRNVFQIYVNANDELLIRKERLEVKDLKQKIKLFISNPNQDPTLARSPKKAVISLKNDRETSFKMYIEVYDNIKRAYNELRNELALELHGRYYKACNKEQQRELRNSIPLIISEAEPSDYTK